MLERRRLVEARIAGIDVVLVAGAPGGVAPLHLLDASADIGAARRFAARAVERPP